MNSNHFRACPQPLTILERKTLLKRLEKSLNYLFSIDCDVNGEKDSTSPLYHAIKNKDHLIITRLQLFD